MDEDGVRRPGPAVRYGEIKAINTKDMVKAGVAAGNIFVQSAEAETMELPQVSTWVPSVRYCPAAQRWRWALNAGAVSRSGEIPIRVYSEQCQTMTSHSAGKQRAASEAARAGRADGAAAAHAGPGGSHGRSLRARTAAATGGTYDVIWGKRGGRGRPAGLVCACCGGVGYAELLFCQVTTSSLSLDIPKRIRSQPLDGLAQGNFTI